MMQQYIIDIHISSDEYLKMYSGQAKNVLTVARNGLRIRFPAARLRPFVTQEGVSGSFLLYVNDEMKLVEIRRL